MIVTVCIVVLTVDRNRIFGGAVQNWMNDISSKTQGLNKKKKAE